MQNKLKQHKTNVTLKKQQCLGILIKILINLYNFVAKTIENPKPSYSNCSTIQ